jgi:D-xylose transport system permease protein
MKLSSSTLDEIIQELKYSFQRNIRQYTMFIALGLIWLVFSALTDGLFISSRNLSNLFLQSATVAIVAIGMVLIIVSGHIDLSIGSFVGCIGALTGVLMVRYGFDPFTAIIIGLIAGAVIGAWQGFWVAYRGVPAFIVTLSSMMVLRGVAIGLTRGATQAPLPEGFLVLGQSYLPQIGIMKNDFTALVGILVVLVFLLGTIMRRVKLNRLKLSTSPFILFVSYNVLWTTLILFAFFVFFSYRGLPIAVTIMMVTGGVFFFISEKSVFGRQIYAIGGNIEAARLSGIKIKARVFVLFIIMGVLTSIASFVFTARVGGATAAAGQMLELDVVAAVVIGGASLSGGVGTVAGAIVGALVMSSLDNGMSLMNLEVTYQMIVKGLILLFAVAADMANKRHSR